MANSYTAKVQVDDNGEYFIVIPEEITAELDMLEGCVVEWFANNDGSFTIQKVK